MLGEKAEITEIQCLCPSLMSFVSLGNQAKRHVLISALFFALQIWSFVLRSPYCIHNLQCGVLSLREFFFSLASCGSMKNGSSNVFSNWESHRDRNGANGTERPTLVMYCRIATFPSPPILPAHPEGRQINQSG